MTSIACLNNCESGKNTAASEYTPDIRIDKVLSVRRQLGEGRYCVAEKLDVVVDRILEALLKQ